MTFLVRLPEGVHTTQGQERHARIQYNNTEAEQSAIHVNGVLDKDKVVDKELGDQEFLPHRLLPIQPHLPVKVRVFEELDRPLHEAAGIIRVGEIAGKSRKTKFS